MIVHLKHHEIDKKKWDECIDQCKWGRVYVLSWWLDIVSPQWEALIEGDYDKVMPLPVKRKFGIKYVINPYFVQQLGVFSRENLLKDDIVQFFRVLKRSYIFCKFNLNVQNSCCISGKLKSNQYIDLQGTYEELKNKYSESTKKNIRKAIKKENIIEVTNSIDVILKMLGKDHPELWNWKNKKIAQNLLYASIERNMGFLYVSKQHSKYTSARFIVKYKNRLYIVLSATEEEAYQSRAKFLSMDKIIQDYSGKKNQIDFLGSSISGIKYFNDGFGAIEESYSVYKHSFYGLL